MIIWLYLIHDYLFTFFIDCFQTCMCIIATFEGLRTPEDTCQPRDSNLIGWRLNLDTWILEMFPAIIFNVKPELRAMDFHL